MKKQFSDGHYVGDMLNKRGRWRRHGIGTFTWTTGGVFKGDWVDDKRQGFGIYTHGNGKKYEGGWRNNLFHGEGILYEVNGNNYSGEFKDGKMNGRGHYKYQYGQEYDGDWKDGKRHGKGVNKFIGGRYEGEWSDGKEHGKGTHTYSNGERYEGEWSDGEKHGKGTYTWPSGARYEGEWSDGKKHGKGTYTSSDGVRKRGLWLNGLLDKHYKIEEDYLDISTKISKDIQKIAEAEGRTVQEIYEDLMDDGIINKSNVEKGPVMTQQLNDEFEELTELTVSNAQAYEDWMDLAANGQRMQEGAIADVWRIKSDQGNLFIKTAYDEKGKKVLLKEIATLEDLMEENLGSSHPHIFFQSKDGDKPLLVMTQVGERSLETDYDNLDVQQGMNFLHELALDIQRLHEYGHYIHRDLKPGNIAINDTKSGNSIYAGLIDFGSARSNMRKQGEGDRFISEPWTHPSQREIGVRVRPGQDWYSFTWIAMCVIMGAKYDKIQAMIEGGSFETKFKNKIANIDSKGRENFLSTLEELIELVTKFGEIPDLEQLEIFDKKS